MTVPLQIPVNSYIYAGSSTFIFAFQVLQDSDLVVSVDSIEKISGIDYTTSGIGDPAGGVVTYLSALVTGQNVTLQRVTVRQRTTDYQNNGDFLADTVNNDFDRIWQALQETDTLSDSRALLVPIGESVNLLPNAATRGGQILAFAAGTGQPIAIPIPTTSGTDATALALSLADASNVSKGAGQIGFLYSLAYGVGTVGKWLKDLAGSTGSAFIGFLQAGTGAVARLVQDKLRERVSVFDFMTTAQIADSQLASPVLNHATAIQAARDYIAGLTRPARLVFPAGTYRYDVSPNWAIQDAEIVAEGEVRLRYFGVGNAVILDAGAGAQLIYNVTMGRFIVEAPNTALNGVFVRSVHHSNLSFNVRGAGTASAGLLVNFAVCTTFDNFTCSVNEAGWYLGAKPAAGMALDKRGAGESTSYCCFINAVVEGPTTGGLLTDALGNGFHGGTFEGCSSIGVNIASASRENKFYGTDFEVNTTHDIYIQGYENDFYGVDSDKQVTIDNLGKLNRFFGGSLQSITLVSGSTKNLFQGCTYNRFATTGTISDAGTYNSFGTSFNTASASLGKIPVKVALTVGASPYTYTNTTGDVQMVLMSGGTVSNLTYGRGVTGDTVAYVTNTPYWLRPGDALIVTYSVVPTMLVYQ